MADAPELEESAADTHADYRSRKFVVFVGGLGIMLLVSTIALFTRHMPSQEWVDFNGSLVPWLAGLYAGFNVLERAVPALAKILGKRAQ